MEIYALTYLVGAGAGRRVDFYAVDGGSRFFIDTSSPRVFAVTPNDFCVYDAILAGKSSDVSAAVIGKESPVTGIVKALVSSFIIANNAAQIASESSASVMDGLLKLGAVSRHFVNGHNKSGLEAAVEVASGSS